MKIILPVKDCPSVDVISTSVINLKTIHKSRKKIHSVIKQFSKQKTKDIKKILKKYKKPTLSFRLRGKVAGKAYSEINLLKLNAVLTNNSLYTEHMLTEVLAHEYAHLIIGLISYHTNIKYRSHGKEWRSVVKALGYTPETFHTMKTTPGRRTLRIKGKCSCRKFLLTKDQHYNVQMGLLSCSSCKTKIKSKKRAKFKYV